jgi:hypothetical protein
MLGINHKTNSNLEEVAALPVRNALRERVRKIIAKTKDFRLYYSAGRERNHALQ